MTTCNLCGRCCSYIGQLLPDTPEWREYAAERGFKVTGKTKTHFTAIALNVCPHLTTQNKCRIHDHKPQLCKQYPTKSDPLLPECGYRRDSK